MIRSCCALLAVLCLVTSALPAAPQTVNASQTSPPKTKRAAASDASPTPDPAAEVRRTTAILLINSLADDARNFRDLTLRARVQMQVAEMLWETETKRARTLFRRAWEAAVVADRENARRRDEDMQEQLKTRGAAVFSDIPNLRAEVLRLAARRDPKLGEEFFKQMDEEKKRAEEEAASRPDTAAARSDNPELLASLHERLGLATELLQEGDVERAMQFAGPALDYLTMSTIAFLSLLRTKNAASADEHYAALLNKAAANPLSDANTVSLLSSYAFTPGLFITASRGGGLGSSRRDSQPAPNLSPALRAAFFRVASQVLLRPLAPPDQDRTSAGRFGTHFIASRLLPLFEQYAPDVAPLLNARIATLAQELPERRRNPNREMLTEGLVPAASPDGAPPPPPREETPETLDDVERQIKPDTTADQRDQIYMSAAMRAASKRDIRARDFAGKIEDADLRKQVRAYVDFDLVRGALAKNDAQETIRLAQTSEFPHVKRVWAYTEAARLLSKTDPARAIEILEVAGEDAHRIDPADPDRPRALVAIVTQMAELNRSRAWEVMSEVVKAANAAEEFTGEDGRIISQVKGKHSSSITDPRVTAFDLTGIFRTLAQDDLNRSIEFARSFIGDAPRATATLAIAHAVLDKKASDKR